MRFVGLDVHRDFCEVAIAESGEVQLAGRERRGYAAEPGDVDGVLKPGERHVGHGREVICHRKGFPSS